MWRATERPGISRYSCFNAINRHSFLYARLPCKKITMWKHAQSLQNNILTTLENKGEYILVGWIPFQSQQSWTFWKLWYTFEGQKHITVKHQQRHLEVVNIMMRCCFSAYSIGTPHITEGRINGNIYRDILDENMLPSTRMMKMTRVWIVQQDSDPKYTARCWWNWTQGLLALRQQC